MTQHVTTHAPSASRSCSDPESGVARVEWQVLLLPQWLSGCTHAYAYAVPMPGVPCLMPCPCLCYVCAWYRVVVRYCAGRTVPLCSRLCDGVCCCAGHRTAPPPDDALLCADHTRAYPKSCTASLHQVYDDTDLPLLPRSLAKSGPTGSASATFATIPGRQYYSCILAYNLAGLTSSRSCSNGSTYDPTPPAVAGLVDGSGAPFLDVTGGLCSSWTVAADDESGVARVSIELVQVTAPTADQQ